MWSGYQYDLALYGLTISVEWYERGNEDNMMDKFNDLMVQYRDNNREASPWWVNSELLRLTHQSNLMRKASDLYDFNVPDNIPYVWPLMDEQAFRLGTYKKGDNLTMLGNNIVYLTSKQVAELLGVSPKTISSYKARGQMPAPDREYGRTPLWKYSTIQEWRKDLRTPIKTEQ
jgi:predicted DNA-binding transcriptional regulator AlpA